MPVAEHKGRAVAVVGKSDGKMVLTLPPTNVDTETVTVIVPPGVAVTGVAADDRVAVTGVAADGVTVRVAAVVGVMVVSVSVVGT